MFGYVNYLYNIFNSTIDYASIQNHANIEDYAWELEEVVNQEAGLNYDIVDSDDCDIITGKTRQFLMKWALYTSKMLTEVSFTGSKHSLVN